MRGKKSSMKKEWHLEGGNRNFNPGWFQEKEFGQGSQILETIFKWEKPFPTVGTILKRMEKGIKAGGCKRDLRNLFQSLGREEDSPGCRHAQ